MEGMPIPDYVRDSYPESAGYQDVEWKIPRGLNGNSLPAIVHPKENTSRSFWLPTKEEINALQEGHYIMLTVVGSQPPVAVTVI